MTAEQRQETVHLLEQGEAHVPLVGESYPRPVPGCWGGFLLKAVGSNKKISARRAAPTYAYQLAPLLRRAGPHADRLHCCPGGAKRLLDGRTWDDMPACRDEGIRREHLGTG